MDLPASMDFLTRDTLLALVFAATLILGVLWAGTCGPQEGGR